MSRWRGFLDKRRVVQLVALLLASGSAILLLAAPLYSGETTAVSSDGTTTATRTAATLAEVNGGWVIGLVLVPVALVAVHALWAGRGRTAAIVACTAPVALLGLVGILTIGVFFLPAVIVSGVSLLVPARPATSRAPRTA